MLDKCENLSLDPQESHKKLAMVVHAYNSSGGAVGDTQQRQTVCIQSTQVNILSKVKI